jgi:hypothetical protein
MFVWQTATLYYRLVVTVMLCNAKFSCATCHALAAIGRTSLSSMIYMGHTACASLIRVAGPGVSEVGIVGGSDKADSRRRPVPDSIR